MVGSPGQRQNIRIGFNPEKTHVALLTNDREYKWPVEMMPSIVAGLRACADGDIFPDASKGMVFAATTDPSSSDPKIGLSDAPAIARFANEGGEATMIIDCPTWAYVMPRHEARRMTAQPEEEPPRENHPRSSPRRKPARRSTRRASK
jgi:hypothetical protein